MNEGWINPILADFHIAIIPICHSPKTQNIQFNKFQPHDFQYTAAGCAAIANLDSCHDRDHTRA